MYREKPPRSIFENGGEFPVVFCMLGQTALPLYVEKRTQPLFILSVYFIYVSRIMHA